MGITIGSLFREGKGVYTDERQIVCCWDAAESLSFGLERTERLYPYLVFYRIS